MSRVPRALRLVAAALAWGVVSACSPDVVDPGPAGPGALTVRLVTPNSGDAAVRITITGPGITAIEAEGTALAFSRQAATTVHHVMLFGEISTGAVLRFDVPERRDIAQYAVHLTEVADGANALRSSLSGYSVAIEY